MSVKLMRRELTYPTSTRLIEVAKWVRPRDNQRYWHIPRDGELSELGSVLVSLWCGPHRFITMDDLTDGAPPSMQCGTCVGRYEGWKNEQQLVFKPRSAFDIPTRCPGSCGDGPHCDLCGARVRGSYSYGGWRESSHRPGLLIATRTPCPLHGWKWFRPTRAKEADGTGVICDRSLVGFGWGMCGFHISTKEDR